MSTRQKFPRGYQPTLPLSPFSARQCPAPACEQQTRHNARIVVNLVLHVQHAALEHQMEEEKRSRESKLRNRLAEKRKAKEEEMHQAALSESVRASTSILVAFAPLCNTRMKSPPPNTVFTASSTHYAIPCSHENLASLRCIPSLHS